jgi:hypothetical protein
MKKIVRIFLQGGLDGPMEGIGMGHRLQNDHPSCPLEESQDENGEPDDGSNSLWLLYEKAVESRDNSDRSIE